MKRGDVDLGGSDALLGGHLKPFGGLAEFLRDAVTAGVEPPEAKLRLGIAGFGRGAVPFGGLDQVWHQGLAALVHPGETQRRRHQVLPRGLAQ